MPAGSTPALVTGNQGHGTVSLSVVMRSRLVQLFSIFRLFGVFFYLLFLFINVNFQYLFPVLSGQVYSLLYSIWSLPPAKPLSCPRQLCELHQQSHKWTPLSTRNIVFIGTLLPPALTLRGWWVMMPVLSPRLSRRRLPHWRRVISQPGSAQATQHNHCCRTLRETRKCMCLHQTRRRRSRSAWLCGGFAQTTPSPKDCRCRLRPSVCEWEKRACVAAAPCDSQLSLWICVHYLVFDKQGRVCTASQLACLCASSLPSNSSHQTVCLHTLTRSVCRWQALYVCIPTGPLPLPHVNIHVTSSGCPCFTSSLGECPIMCGGPMFSHLLCNGQRGRIYHAHPKN